MYWICILWILCRLYWNFMYIFLQMNGHLKKVSKLQVLPPTHTNTRTTSFPAHLDDGPTHHSAVRRHRVEVDVVVHVIGLPRYLKGGGRGGTQQSHHITAGLCLHQSAETHLNRDNATSQPDSSVTRSMGHKQTLARRCQYRNAATVSLCCYWQDMHIHT